MANQMFQKNNLNKHVFYLLDLTPRLRLEATAR